MKRFKQTIGGVILLVFVITCVVFVLPGVGRGGTTGKAESNSATVLTMWHIEGFEGGVGSRCDWLGKRAREFEKRNKGVYLDVIKLTEAQLEDRLAQGQSFDLISFGLGVGESVLPHLAAFDGSISADIHENLLSGGKINGKTFALPYMCGGYVLAARTRDLTSLTRYISLKQSVFDCYTTKKVGKKTVELFSVMTAKSDYCCPLVGLAMLADGKERDISKVCCEPTLTQYGAYERFLSGNAATILLGTQRDYWRLKGRMDNGKIGEICFAALSDYTDLVQYVGMGNSKDRTRTELSESFAEYLTSKAVQEKLSGVGMLPVIDSAIYVEKVLNELSAGIGDAKTLNVFTSHAVLSKLYEELKKVIADGEKNLLKKYLA